jgi:hypothetical protein
VSTCLVDAKFQEGLPQDLDAIDQLCPLQEDHVKYYINNISVCHLEETSHLKIMTIKQIKRNDTDVKQTSQGLN